MNERKFSASMYTAYDHWMRRADGLFHSEAAAAHITAGTGAHERWAGLKGAQSTDCTKTRCREDAWFCENVESWTACLTSGGNRALMAATIHNHEIR